MRRALAAAVVASTLWVLLLVLVEPHFIPSAFAAGGTATSPYGKNRTHSAGVLPPPFDVLAPTNGVGMTVECDSTNPTSSKGATLNFTRSGAVECISGDGQTITQVPTGIVRQKKACATCTRLELQIEDAVANRLGTASRDLSAGAFVKTNVTCTRTAHGMRGGDTNGASRCTATADGGSVIITVDHSNFSGTGGSCGDFFVRKDDGGTLNGFFVTYDGGSYRDVTSSLAWTWKRVAQAVDVNLDTTILTSGMCGGSAMNANLGFKLGAAGDSVDVDFVDVQTNDVIDQGGGRAISLSPVELTDGTPKATHHDNLALPTPAGFNNTQGCVGYTATWGSPNNRYACPQLCTDNDGGFFAYYDVPPNFWVFDGVNNWGPANDGVDGGVAVSTESGWSGGNGGTMFGANSNGAMNSGAYDGKMIGGGGYLVIGSQFTISGNPCWLNGLISNIKLGPTATSCHW